jgi:MoxR-like ATPase
MADEINRASPRTQSALLQAMQEREVTIAGQHRPLGRPFHVLATQNPIEQEGTYPLPEAQLDRFLVQVDVGYPDRATERAILLATTGTEEAGVEAVFTPAALLEAQTLIRRMPVGDSVVNAILTLVRACRPGTPEADPSLADSLSWGPGPRAAQALMLTVRARALLQGRLAPSVEDVAEYCEAKGWPLDAQKFVDFYASKGWKVGRVSMKDWRAAVGNAYRSADKWCHKQKADGRTRERDWSGAGW